jgi:hypothetical protein
MNTQAVLKAGGLGGVLLIVLSLLGYIPCVGCITAILGLLAYVGIGIMAAKWMDPPRTASGGATNGALAAVVAGLISGLVNMVISGIYFAITGTAQFGQALSDLPPDQMAAMSELGIDPSLLAGGAGIVGVLGISALCCTLGIVIAALLGAVGGAFWGNSHPS